MAILPLSKPTIRAIIQAWRDQGQFNLTLC